MLQPSLSARPAAANWPLPAPSVRAAGAVGTRPAFAPRPCPAWLAANVLAKEPSTDEADQRRYVQAVADACVILSLPDKRQPYRQVYVSLAARLAKAEESLALSSMALGPEATTSRTPRDCWLTVSHRARLALTALAVGNHIVLDNPHALACVARALALLQHHHAAGVALSLLNLWAPRAALACPVDAACADEPAASQKQADIDHFVARTRALVHYFLLPRTDGWRALSAAYS